MEAHGTAAARAPVVPALPLVLRLVLPLVLVLVAAAPVSAAVVTKEGMAEEVPVCESATAHSHATCDEEFEHLIQQFNMSKTPVSGHWPPLTRWLV